MKIDSIKFALTAAITAVVVWIVCSAVVFLLPKMMLSLSGNMIHMNLDRIGWHLSLSGIVMGLFGWFFISGIIAWLFAKTYNALIHD